DGGGEGRRAVVPFHGGRVADADARLVVRDGDGSRAVGDARALGGVGELDAEVLVGLDDAVAAHGDRDRLAGLALGEGQLAGGGVVVAAGRRRAVGGAVAHRHLVGV